jgi:DNA modification methylase
MRNLDDGQMKLVVTSPPYNLGKTKERRTSVDEYLEWQERVIRECVRVLHPNGSICWQVGNYVHRGEIIPLDALFYHVFEKLGLKLRNRIVWHFGHGMHCSKRLSGRYETINWWTDGYSRTHSGPESYLLVIFADGCTVRQRYPIVDGDETVLEFKGLDETAEHGVGVVGVAFAEVFG